MLIQLFEHLPEEAQLVRTKVFIEEQGFQQEYDETDNTAWHLVGYENEKPAAACRFFWSDQKQAYVLGRLAVLPEYRGNGFGAAGPEYYYERLPGRE